VIVAGLTWRGGAKSQNKVTQSAVKELYMYIGSVQAFEKKLEAAQVRGPPLRFLAR
jgi:hypothetical protein